MIVFEVLLDNIRFTRKIFNALLCSVDSRFQQQ